MLTEERFFLNTARALPRNSDFVFKKGLLRYLSGSYRRHRKKLTRNLSCPDLNRITFKTFRHFKGTMVYHKTKDVLHVKYVLGHPNIKNTLVYIHLLNFRADEFISKVAKDADEACTLIESGFEFVCTTPDDLMVFRKRK